MSAKAELIRQMVSLAGLAIPVIWGVFVLAFTLYLSRLAWSHSTVEKGPPGWYVNWLIAATCLLAIDLAIADVGAAKQLVLQSGDTLVFLLLAGLAPWLGYKALGKYVDSRYGKPKEDKSAEGEYDVLKRY